MTKARTNASASPAVGRNMVINGAMNVSQRATSVTGLGANADAYNTLDRFKLGVEGTTAGRLTMAQVADGPNGISANCLKLDCTTADTSIAATEFVGVSTYLEGQNVQRLGKGIAGAKQAAISFYVKASSSLTFAVELFDADNGRHIVKLFTATTAWNRIEFYIPADEDDGSSALNDDNATSLVINFWVHGGTNFTSGTLATAWANKTNANRAAGIDSIFSNTANNFFLTGVQLEVGPVATEFEQEDISTTLAKCQRYFAIIKGTSDSKFQRFGRGHCFNTTNAPMGAFLPQNMRAFPALGSTGTPANYHVNNGSATTALSANPSLDGGSDFFVDGTATNHVNYLAVCSSGLTEGRGCSLNGNNSAAAFISFDSEL